MPATYSDQNYPEQDLNPPEYHGCEEDDCEWKWDQRREEEACAQEARWESDRDDRLLNTGSVKP